MKFTSRYQREHVISTHKAVLKLYPLQTNANLVIQFLTHKISIIISLVRFAMQIKSKIKSFSFYKYLWLCFHKIVEIFCSITYRGSNYYLYDTHHNTVTTLPQGSIVINAGEKIKFKKNKVIRRIVASIVSIF